MEREEIKEKILSIIREKLDSKVELNEDTRFIEDLNADSLDLLEVVIGLEEVFKIHVPDQDLIRLRTVGDAISYAQEKLKEG